MMPEGGTLNNITVKCPTIIRPFSLFAATLKVEIHIVQIFNILNLQFSLPAAISSASCSTLKVLFFLVSCRVFTFSLCLAPYDYIHVFHLRPVLISALVSPIISTTLVYLSPFVFFV